MFLWMYIARNQRCERDRLCEVSTILIKGMLQPWDWASEVSWYDVNLRASPPNASGQGLGRRIEQSHGIYAPVVSVSTIVSMSLSDRYRYDVIPDMWINDDRRINSSEIRFQRHKLSIFCAYTCRRVGRNFSPAPPSCFEHGVRYFLKPGLVGTPPVVEVE